MIGKLQKFNEIYDWAPNCGYPNLQYFNMNFPNWHFSGICYFKGFYQLHQVVYISLLR